MSIPVVAPSRLQAFATKAYWQNGLAAAMEAVYPGGPLTGLVDVVEDGWAGAALPYGL